MQSGLQMYKRIHDVHENVFLKRKKKKEKKAQNTV